MQINTTQTQQSLTGRLQICAVELVAGKGYSSLVQCKASVGIALASE